MTHFTELSRKLSPKIVDITERDRRYAYEAYPFVMEAVERSVADLAEKHHITGRELCEAIRALALTRFGPMAKDVLHFWGIHATVDLGNIVFNLVGEGLLLKTEEDDLADFIDVYDFDTAFERDSDDA
jgi:uncharacterized repeat protein (TIGR04138 family)